MYDEEENFEEKFSSFYDGGGSLRYILNVLIA